MAKKERFRFFYALTLAFQLGFLIAVPLAIFLWIGIYLDKKFSASPLFLILSIIFSFMFIFWRARYYFPLILKK
jgi:F0F1-type ATP synthase assembly protein I